MASKPLSLLRSRLTTSKPTNHLKPFTLIPHQQPSRTYTSTPPLSNPPAKNRLYNPVRQEDEFETLNLLSSSSRTPLLTFWSASWCPSCASISPILKSLIEEGVGEKEGGVSYAVVELDSPTLGPLAMRYEINSMPTLLAFDRQEAQLQTKVTRVDDMKNREFLIRWIETEAKRHGEGGAGGRSLFSFFSR